MPKPKQSYGLWVTGLILRGLFTALIFFVCAFLLWRVFFSSKLPREMKRLAPNAALAAAYAEHGEDLELFTQEQATVTRGERDAGYFGVPRCVFIPQADQVQLVFRYNNSTLKHLQADFNLSERPERGVELFDVTIVSMRDLTPEDTSDNKDGSETIEKTRIAPTDKKIDTTALYTYFLYTFDGVSTDSDIIALFLDVYFEDAIDYTREAYGTLRLYHAESSRESMKLTSAERKAIEAFAD